MTAPSTTVDTLLAGLPAHVAVHQLYLGCLSQASYVVGDRRTGRAVAVDPRRDVDELLAVARADGLTIELVVETHLHADFLSGHLELEAATGAPIAFGAAATTEFPSRALADGERIDLGGVELEVLATPGHTPESISLVVRPAPGADPVAVLTGDTLFVGDVGRPDLLVSTGRSAEEMARLLHGSLRTLARLPDDALVLPAHGAGSACGRSLSAETASTIGEQRRTNHALQVDDEDEFVALVTEGRAAAPEYFGHDARLNRMDRELLDEAEPLRRFDLVELDAAVATGAVVIDTRPADAFARGHLAGSLHVGLEGRFAEQVGSVVAPGTTIVLVADPGDGDGRAPAREAQVRLARIGFDGVVGVVADLSTTLRRHPDRAAQLSRLTAADATQRRQDLGDRLQLVDVRGPGEVQAAPLDGARNLPLAELRGRLGELDRHRPVLVVCAGGARSAIASSVLLAEGFDDVSDVLGGTNALGVAAACSTGASS